MTQIGLSVGQARGGRETHANPRRLKASWTRWCHGGGAFQHRNTVVAGNATVVKRGMRAPAKFAVNLRYDPRIRHPPDRGSGDRRCSRAGTGPRRRRGERTTHAVQWTAAHRTSNTCALHPEPSLRTTFPLVHFSQPAPLHSGHSTMRSSSAHTRLRESTSTAMLSSSSRPVM